MEQKIILAIRIRGGVNASKQVEDTMKMLRMLRNNSSTILDNEPTTLGMLQKAKDFITWGEPTKETIHLLLSKRGRTIGNGDITGEILNLGFSNLLDLASAIHDGKVEFHKLKRVKPFFRLHPPKKGFKRSIKRPYRSKGELGYRGEAINELAKRMA
jgi:large subunit ribosomal protein L30